ELRKRPEIAEVGLADATLDAALPPQSGLVGQQTMQEVQVRQAAVLSLVQGVVQLLGRHRDAQGGEVGADLLTPARRCRAPRRLAFLGSGLHRRVPSARATTDTRWSAAGRSAPH